LRRLLAELLTLEHLRGGLIVAPDGLVIATQFRADVPVEAVSALAASLGRELELDDARRGRTGFLVAHFRAEDGSIFLGGTPLGFIVLVAEAQADRDRVRQALRGAVDTLRRAWPH
jgi:predicted regulator of Ras-like GTPase activity (Roadblock/LC7/MglB family)